MSALCFPMFEVGGCLASMLVAAVWFGVFVLPPVSGCLVGLYLCLLERLRVGRWFPFAKMVALSCVVVLHCVHTSVSFLGGVLGCVRSLVKSTRLVACPILRSCLIRILGIVNAPPF